MVSFLLQIFGFLFPFNVDLGAWAIRVLFRKSSPVTVPSRLLATFSSVSYSVSGFMLRSLMLLESFVQGDQYGTVRILLHADIQLDRHHLLKMLFPPVCIFCFFIRNQVSIGIWIYACVVDH